MFLSHSNTRENATNTVYSNVRNVNTADELQQVAKFDHVAGIFKDNKRSIKTFMKADCVIMDCDNNDSDAPETWVTPEQISERLKGVEFFTVYSRNHNKDKKKKGEIITARPRFHLYFSLSKEFTKETEISQIKQRILKICPEFDAGAKDTPHFIYGVANPQVKFFQGSKRIDEFLDTAVLAKTITPTATVNTTPTTATTAKYKNGERNSSLYNTALNILLKIKDSKKAFSIFMKECNKCESPLDSVEIQNIWHSALKSDLVYLRQEATQLFEQDSDTAEDIFYDEIAVSYNEAIAKKAWRSAMKIFEREHKKKKTEAQNLTARALEREMAELNIQFTADLITKKAKVSGLPENCEYTFERFEKLSKSRKTNEGLDALPIFLTDFLKDKGYNFSQQKLIDMLNHYSLVYAVNPVADFLESAKWDGVDRLPEIFDILQIGDNELYKTYIKKWLIQCVAMAYNDNHDRKNEIVLTLQGRQGIGKTRFFEKLLCFNKEWLKTGAVIDVNNKDSVISATSVWICELGELDATLKKEQASLKSFLTNTEDSYRPPYGKSEKIYPRRTAFCATVNDDKFLRDTTQGSRRWAVIKLKDNIKVHSKMAFLPDDFFMQLWRQAYEMYIENENGYFLSQQEREALEKCNEESAIFLNGELEVREHLQWTLPTDKWTWKTASEIIDKAHLKGVSAKQIGRALTKIQKSDTRIKIKKTSHNTLYLLPDIINLENQTHIYEREIQQLDTDTAKQADTQADNSDFAKCEKIKEFITSNEHLKFYLSEFEAKRNELKNSVELLKKYFEKQLEIYERKSAKVMIESTQEILDFMAEKVI